MSELPNGWIELTLDKLLTTCESGSRPKGGVSGIEQGVPSIGGEHLSYSGEFNFSSIKYVPTAFAQNMKKGKVKINDILIVKDGATTGKTVIVTKSFPFDFAVVNEHVFICRPKEQNDARYIFHFLRSDSGQKRILDNFQGSAQGGINKSFTAGTAIPLPSTIDEQSRIVERIEQLLGKINVANKRLDKIPTLLKRFRQSVLSAACSGRLTADWREGKELGEWEQKQLKDIVNEGGIFDGPFGSNLKTSDYIDHGVRVVRLENIANLRFINEKTAYISNEKYETLKKHTVGCGDIIFSSFISDNTRVCLLPELDTLAIAKADCFCIRPKQSIADSQYLCFVLASVEMFHQLFNLIHGATRPRINTTQLKQVEITIPPLPEQKEIVRRADMLFGLVDKIEMRYNAVRKSLAKAERAIYAKAFRGEL